jgi:hypothetical protein
MCICCIELCLGSISSPSLSSPQLSQAPPTIEDAIICTQALGFQYLWVDRYCIDQSDPETKHALIQRMDQIYRKASLSIINARGEGADCGLPGVSDTPHRLQNSVTTGEVTFSTVPNAKMELACSAWSLRGCKHVQFKSGEQNTDTVIGTYQEGFIPRRRLIFGQSQVAFQCLKTCTCEAIPIALLVPQDYGNSACSSRKINDVIQSLPGPLEVRGSRTFAKKARASGLFSGTYLYMRINGYLKKSLSYESDTLNAFMGVLRYAWFMSIPTYHFWDVSFGEPMHPLVDNYHDGAFLIALFWRLEKYADAKHLHEFHVSRRDPFLS